MKMKPMKIQPRILRISACITLVSGAIAAANAASNSSAADLLRVNLYPAQDGTAEVTVTNTSDQVARIPKWQLPQEVLDSDLFRITRDGKQVPYEGRLIKRGTPQAEDFAVIRPGQTYRTIVDLAATYDLSEPGQYTIAFSTELQHASLSDGTRLQRGPGQPLVIATSKQSFWNLGTTVEPISRLLPASGPKAIVNGVSYVGCSSGRIQRTGAAFITARNYSENAKKYLNANKQGPRYTTWFGTYNSGRYATARQNFSQIDTAIDQSNGEIQINCGCDENIYAYVYSNRPYEIFVCRKFWAAPRRGTDSKGGTLIHEISHFSVVVGTGDYAYGHDDAKELARTYPDYAVRNADSHEYFAENTPSQN